MLLSFAELNGIDLDDYSTSESVERDMKDSLPSSGSRNKRTVIEGSLKDALEKHFSADPKPSPEVIASLADSLRLKRKTVHFWFANRRQKEKFTKRVTELKTPLRKTRLSASRILTSDEIVDETEDENNSSVVHFAG
jgi:hypothetical protein